MNWTRINEHYQNLMKQVYPQPDEEGRIGLFREALIWSGLGIKFPCKSILDIGCGEGYAQELLEYFGMNYTGIAWGNDVKAAKNRGRNVTQMDMNSLDYPDKSFDGFIMSHSWEHSPMPILMLMEAKRVTKHYGLIVLPHPDWYKFRGRNHFSVMLPAQVENLLEHTGYQVVNYHLHQRNGSPDFDMPNILTNDEIWYVVEQA
jgi:SAM-dependent methyltransferase